jgi:hypothetical protein
MKSKRPWKKYAQIDRVEYNSGDVKFSVNVNHRVTQRGSHGSFERQTFESLTEAEQYLDKWWASWWPQQVRDVKPT